MFTILKKTEMEPLTTRGFYDIKEKINFSPLYQRYGGIWKKTEKQLLIDTIINGFDIPKFYFNYFPTSDNILNDDDYTFAIIDGKQRLLAIKEFFQDDFPLSDSFVYYKDENLNLKGLTYSDIARNHPDIIRLIDEFILDIVYVLTDEEEKIEELFLRLNGGKSLNNAERRNAIGGFLNSEIRHLIENHPFFRKKLRFKNPRYQYQDLMTKLLYVEEKRDLVNLDNNILDRFVRKNRENSSEVRELVRTTTENLNNLEEVFNEKDPLLSGKSIVPVYYWILTRNLIPKDSLRSFLSSFEEQRRDNKKLLPEQQNAELVDYDRWNQQGTHKSKSLKGRLEILLKYYKR